MPLNKKDTQGKGVKNASTVSEDTASNQEPTLHRGLHNRHIQLIALGGAIGTGLFLGIGPAIQMAGPAVLLGYGVAGIIAFLIMRQLGEMVVEEPVSGSFAHFAYTYWGPFAGFLSGWNYWVMFVLVGMAELTAAGIYLQYWFPDVPTWIWAAALFIIITSVKLVNLRLYGETEFWFALIKVLAIIGMIGFGLWLLFSGHGGEKASIDNLWRYGGFFATGWNGLILSLAVIMFSFGGLELIGITAVPTWIWAAALFIIITSVKLVNLRLYGETEFWFALIKVLAIIGMIGFGLWLLFSGHGGEKASIDNLWRYGGFFATGWNGLILSLAVIMFSFGGLELIGITAARKPVSTTSGATVVSSPPAGMG